MGEGSLGFCSLGLQGPERGQGDPLGLFPGVRPAQEIRRVTPLTSSKEGFRANLGSATGLCDLGHIPSPLCKMRLT